MTVELTSWPDTDEKVLHVFAQIEWHTEAFILGTAPALRALRDAIDGALKDGQATCSDLFVNDGEGYEVIIKVVNDKWALQHLAVPYTDSIAKERYSNPNVLRRDDERVK